MLKSRHFKFNCITAEQEKYGQERILQANTDTARTATRHSIIGIFPDRTINAPKLNQQEEKWTPRSVSRCALLSAGFLYSFAPDSSHVTVSEPSTRSVTKKLFIGILRRQRSTCCFQGICSFCCMLYRTLLLAAGSAS